MVAALWRAHRPAVLLVTHDVDEALTLADRVLVLDEGRIAFDAPVPLARPRRHSDRGFVDAARPPALGARRRRDRRGGGAQTSAGLDRRATGARPRPGLAARFALLPARAAASS